MDEMVKVLKDLRDQIKMQNKLASKALELQKQQLEFMKNNPPIINSKISNPNEPTYSESETINLLLRK